MHLPLQHPCTHHSSTDAPTTPAPMHPPLQHPCTQYSSTHAPTTPAPLHPPFQQTSAFHHSVTAPAPLHCSLPHSITLLHRFSPSCQHLFNVTQALLHTTSAPFSITPALHTTVALFSITATSPQHSCNTLQHPSNTSPCLARLLNL